VEIELFWKILQNKVDEQFWHMQQHVKEQVKRLYKTFLVEKYPRVLASELATIEMELIQDMS